MHRQRRWLVGGLVVAIAAGLIGVASAASGQAHRSPLKAWGFQPGTSAGPAIPHIARAKMLVVRLGDVTAASVDNPPSGTSVGDEIAVEGKLVALDGTPAGQLEVHEVVTGMGQVRGGRFQITFTALLGGGQISGIGASRFNRPTPALAIAGGTGKYLGAHGELFVHNGPHQTRLTFVLLPR
jgi:hypothetical protein